jgi:transcription antitermination protein NusB
VNDVSANLSPVSPAQGKSVGSKPGAKSGRRRAREIALQGLYEWLISAAEPALIEAHMREHEGFEQCDAAHFAALLYGCVEQAGELDAALAKHVDRQTKLLSPIEHSVLLIALFEFKHCIDIPYKVVINEAVELAKSFGGTDGHKYVNGVLDKTAIDFRRVEVESYRAHRAVKR